MLAVLSIAANITDYEVGDRFSVDETEFYVELTLEDRSVININNNPRIWRTDDCHTTSLHFVCLVESTNTSARIRTDPVNLSYSLRRGIPEQVRIGEPFRVEITIINHANHDRVFHLQEETAAQIRRPTGFQENLSWTGTIRAESSRTLSYTAIIHEPTRFHATVSEPYEQNNTAVVEVEDFIATDATHVPQTTADSAYPFRMRIQREQDAELFVQVHAPQLTIHDRRNLNAQLARTFMENETAEFAFNYSAARGVRTNITVTITAITEHGESTRTKNYPVIDSFAPLQFIHDYHDAQLPVRQEHALRITVLNPNNESVSAKLTAKSILIDEEVTLTIPAQDTIMHTLRIFSNRSGNDYTISLALTYEDINGVTTTTRDQLRILSTPPPTPPSTQEEAVQAEPTLRLAAQQTSSGYQLLITPQDFTHATGQLIIRQFSDILYNETIPLNATHTVAVNTHGTYTATLSTAELNLTTEHIIQAPRQEPEEQETQEAHTSFVLMSLLILFGFILVLILARIAYVHRRAEHLRELYVHTAAFMSSFTPQTAADQEKLAELQQELERIQQELGQHNY